MSHAPQLQTSLLGEQDIRTVLVDPPWDAEQGGGGKGANAKYPLLSVDEIVRVIQEECPHWDRVCDSAHLWMWTTNTTVCNKDAFAVAEGLGFTPKTQFTWCKEADNGEPQKGIGYYSYGATEHLWLCVRGDAMKPEKRHPTWFSAKRGEHSVKPEASYFLVEQTSPGGYLEIFARRPRDGWTCWGNQICDGCGRYLEITEYDEIEDCSGCDNRPF